MSWITILLIGGGTVLIVLLLWIVIAQIKSTKYLETLKKELQGEERRVAPKKTPPKSAARPSSKPIATTPPKAEPKGRRVETPPQPKRAPKPRPEPKPAPKPQVKPVHAPTAYPAFDNARAIEALGLSQEEADMFVGELVTQIESEIPNIEAALAAGDFETLEKISHMLKGSATSLGEGGVVDVLVALNTYCKSGKDIDVVQGHLADLKHYFKALKAKFS